MKAISSSDKAEMRRIVVDLLKKYGIRNILPVLAEICIAAGDKGVLAGIESGNNRMLKESQLYCDIGGAIKVVSTNLL